MIRNFHDRETELIWLGDGSRKRPPHIQQPGRRKLRQIEGAQGLDDLRVPRGNPLQQWKGFTPPRHSIRINDQWRITFRWSDGGAEDVWIEDYHRG